MKKLFNNETFILIIGIFILLSLVFGLWYLTYRIDKHNCEKKGGIYVYELNSESKGSKCHFKGGK